jgi:SulP family sulfate permease
VVFTHNLAIGVLVGVLLSGLFFAWQDRADLRRALDAVGRRPHGTYIIEGQLFFASRRPIS